MSCEVKDNCMAFLANDCFYCKFAGVSGGQNNYAPLDKTVKHPQAIAEKQKRKDDAKIEKRTKQIDEARSKLVKKANKAEERIRKTLNSGRINRDGDLCTNDLAIDVKLQTKAINPTIKAEEFQKIQDDAERSGKEYGVLIIENSEGKRFVVIPEQMFTEAFV